MSEWHLPGLRAAPAWLAGVVCPGTQKWEVKLYLRIPPSGEEFRPANSPVLLTVDMRYLEKVFYHDI